jgi:NTE family protein
MKRALVLSGGGARGAFQVGVWQYLQEKSWTPDLICGTSIGAINATAIGAGMSVDRLMQIWKAHSRSHFFRITPRAFLKSAFTRRPLKPALDKSPFRALLSRYLDFEALRKSPIEIIISAVQLRTGQLHFFNQDVIEMAHLLATSAMPLLFSWQEIDGELYWDGGVMANSPLFVALEKGAREIVVVLLSPFGHRPQPVPVTLRDGLEMVFEQFLIGTYQATQPFLNGAPFNVPERSENRTTPRITVVSPTHPLGFRSLLNFSSRQVNHLIKEGYRNARLQLDIP